MHDVDGIRATADTEKPMINTPIIEKSFTSKRGFTLIELLVVITIIGTLAALIFPAVSSMRSKAMQTKCSSQLRQWAVAIQGYAGDHNQKVRYEDWEDVGNGKQHYNPYLGGGTQIVPPATRVSLTQAAFRMCPAHKWNGTGNPPACYVFIRPNELKADGSTYGKTVDPVNDTDGDTKGDSYSLLKVARPSQLLVMMDSTVAGGTGGGGKRPYRTYEYTNFVKPVCINENKALVRHGGNVNALFADGHIETLKWDQINPTQEGNTQKVTTWMNLN